MVLLLMSTVSLYRDLEDFTRELQAALYGIGGTWWRRNVTVDDDDPVTSDDDDPPASLIRALAACKSAGWTSRFRVQMEASEWQQSVDTLVNNWARLARAATKLRNTCRLSLALLQPQVTVVATLGELLAILLRQDEEMLLPMSPKSLHSDLKEFTEQLKYTLYTGDSWWCRKVTWDVDESPTSDDDESATSDDDESPTSDDDVSPTYYDDDPPTSLSQALASYESTPWTHRKHVIMAASKWQCEDEMTLLLESPRNFYWDLKFFTWNVRHTRDCIEDSWWCHSVTCNADDPVTSLSRALTAWESIPGTSRNRLSPAQLQPEVTVVAILGELLETLPRQYEEINLHVPKCLYWYLQDFTMELRFTLYHTDDNWWHPSVTSDGDDPVTSLSRALAAYRSTPGTTQNRVTMATSKWQRSVSVLVNSWVQLARAATKLRNACREVANEAADREATTTA
ncbi:unnamed protein product [Coccothraustes coccothraustes]